MVREFESAIVDCLSPISGSARICVRCVCALVRIVLNYVLLLCIMGRCVAFRWMARILWPRIMACDEAAQNITIVWPCIEFVSMVIYFVCILQFIIVL